MSYDPLFDTDQNKALLVICARKAIRGVGIGGIIWGVLNLGFGIVALAATWLNLGLVLLGLLMLIAGLIAVVRPSLHTLLMEAIVSVLLFCWNVGITILNASIGATSHINPHSLIFPAVAAAIFFNQYKKLGHLREAIRTIDAQTVEPATAVCKELLGKKIKQEPGIAEAASKKCRIRFMTDSVFCVQRGLQRAFQMSLADSQKSIKDINAKKLKLVIQHPLGKLTYDFDKKNSEKIKGWLASTPLPSG